MVLLSCAKWEGENKAGRENYPFAICAITIAWKRALWIQQGLAALLSVIVQLVISGEERRRRIEKTISNNEHSRAALHAVALGTDCYTLLLDLTFHHQIAPLGCLMAFDTICRFSSGLSIYNKLRSPPTLGIFIILIYFNNGEISQRILCVQVSSCQLIWQGLLYLIYNLEFHVICHYFNMSAEITKEVEISTTYNASFSCRVQQLYNIPSYWILLCTGCIY